MIQFAPLQITAYPECGIVCDRYLPIDGILKSQLLRDRWGHEDVTISGAEIHDTNESAKWQNQGMPLLKINKRTPYWHYAASFAEWSDDEEGSDHWVKKFDSRLVELIETKRLGRLNVGSGRYRGYHMPCYYRVAREVRWYVVGDAGRIESLLSTVTHLGKKSSQGWGAISRWKIAPCPEDWSIWRGDQLMRAIPSETGILYGIRPSYWLRSNQFVCRLPD